VAEAYPIPAIVGDFPFGTSLMPLMEHVRRLDVRRVYLVFNVNPSYPKKSSRDFLAEIKSG
jgi:hypothetical protein